MELTKIQEKIKKESKTAFFVTVFIGYFSIALFGFMLFLVIATAISPGEYHPNPDTALEEAFTSAVPFFFNGIFVPVVSFFASRVFYESQRNYTPFSRKNTERLKAISHSIGVMAIVLFLYDILGVNISFGGGVELFSINMTWSFASAFAFSYLIIGVLFDLLARIFEYGRLLQQESDETL